MSATARTFLVVNADDFGLSEGVNQGIIRAHEEGIVTSASLMVRACPPAAEDAAAYARTRPQLGVGLHLDLGEWRYRDRQWSVVYEVVPSDDAAALADEVERQMELFVRQVGRPPTHIDSHQHVHRYEPLRGIVARAAAKLKVPLRSVTAGIRYFGEFYGQTGTGEPAHNCISAESLLFLLASLPVGVNEVGCHPGEDPHLGSVYCDERRSEVRVLCDPAIRQAVEALNIELCSFPRVARLVGLAESPPIGSDP